MSLWLIGTRDLKQKEMSLKLKLAVNGFYAMLKCSARKNWKRLLEVICLLEKRRWIAQQ